MSLNSIVRHNADRKQLQVQLGWIQELRTLQPSDLFNLQTSHLLTNNPHLHDFSWRASKKLAPPCARKFLRQKFTSLDSNEILQTQRKSHRVRAPPMTSKTRDTRRQSIAGHCYRRNTDDTVDRWSFHKSGWKVKGSSKWIIFSGELWNDWLDIFGGIGQLKLRSARVLLVGAGGLGCPAAQYLAGAGIGTIGMIDGDTVESSNLHRQVLHRTKNVGKFKVDSAIESLREWVFPTWSCLILALSL